VINHARDGQSKEKVEPSVVFKPEAANGGKVKNISKNNLSFGNFTEKDVVNPVPVHRASIAPVPVIFLFVNARLRHLQFYLSIQEQCLLLQSHHQQYQKIDLS
jgi:hypothetical protein